MKRCKYCQEEIDKKAKICPKCRKKQGVPKWIIVVLAIIIVVVIASISDDENAKEGEISNNNQISEKFTYEIVKQYQDTFSYYIEGSVRNNKDRDYSYVQIEFVCYDSAGNNLGTAFDNTNNLLANQTWKFKAMAFFSGEENIDHCEYHDITSW